MKCELLENANNHPDYDPKKDKFFCKMDECMTCIFRIMEGNFKENEAVFKRIEELE